MNRSMIRDIFWKIYSYLPHCIISKECMKKKACKQFSYQENGDISIVAVNCVGGAIYSILGLEFQSPFINTTIDRVDFIRLCDDFKGYMKCSLELEKHKDGLWYGTLQKESNEKVEIIFVHEHDPEKIQKDWEKRKKRIHYNKLVFICDDKYLDESAYDIYNRFQAYRKIMLTAKEHPQYEWCHQIIKYKNRRFTGRYNFRSWRGGWKFLYLWDFVSFLNGE